jgi:hypothetical protein
MILTAHWRWRSVWPAATKQGLYRGPRWIAILGYVLACILLLGSYYISWSFAVLPLWVFLVSIYILIDDLGRHQKAD